RDAAGGAGAQIAETAASVRERASDVLRDAGGMARARLHGARDTARAKMSEFAEDAASVSDHTSARLRAAMPDEADRDTLLPGRSAGALVRPPVDRLYHSLVPSSGVGGDDHARLLAGTGARTAA